MILGLTGSIGSGKTAVAELLIELGGAVIIDADQLVKEMQQPGKRILNEIVSKFGKQVLQADGTLNRKELAAKVFGNAEQLSILNGIIHPAVYEESRRLIEANRDKPLVVLSVPLLFEIEADRLTDKVLTVILDDEIRFERLEKLRGMTRQEAEKRLASQLPEEEKIKRSDFVIDNSGTPAETRDKVKSFLKSIALLSQ